MVVHKTIMGLLVYGACFPRKPFKSYRIGRYTHLSRPMHVLITADVSMCIGRYEPPEKASLDDMDA